MKSKLILINYIFVQSLVLAVTAFAGSEIRNGGYGVIVQDEVFSLDLYEADVHLEVGTSKLQPSDESEKIKKIIQPVVARLMKSRSAGDGSIIIEETSIRLAVLSRLIEQLGLDFPLHAVVQNASNYTWLYHDVDCLNVRDEQSSKLSLVQLAYRQMNWIRFCRDSQRMDSRNIEALLIHEIFYAAHETKSVTKQIVAIIFDLSFWQSSSEIQYFRLKPIVDLLRKELRPKLWFFATQMKSRIPDHKCFGTDDVKCMVKIESFDCEDNVCHLRLSRRSIDENSTVTMSLLCSKDGSCQLDKNLPGIGPAIKMVARDKIDLIENETTLHLKAE